MGGAMKELAPPVRAQSEEEDWAERIEASEIAALATNTNPQARERENCTPEAYLQELERQVESLGLRLR
jgi:hypothetical protein